MRPEITGGSVRYDKIAFVPFPIGAAGFFVSVALRTVTGRLGLGIGKHLCLKLTFSPDKQRRGFPLAVYHRRPVLADMGLHPAPPANSRTARRRSGSRHLFQVWTAAQRS